MSRGKAKGKSHGQKYVSRSHRAGLSFPVGRIARMLKRGRYTDRVSISGAVFMTAALEYLVAEILDVSVIVVKSNKKMRIVPRYIFLGLRDDPEFKKLFRNAIITQSGNKQTS